MIEIYIILKNNIPIYIGESKNTFKLRKNSHKRRFGKDIEIDIIDKIENNKKSRKFWESYWISQFKTWGFKLENCNEGGGGPEIHSNKTKQKISENRKNKNTKKILQYDKKGNFIKEWESIKEALKSINKEKNNYIPSLHNKNRKTSYGFIWRYKENDNRNLKLIPHKFCKPILQYDLQGNFIKEWFSSVEVSKKLNLNLQGINNCCLNRSKTSGKFIWKYKNII